MRPFLSRFPARQLPGGLPFALLCAVLAGVGSIEAATLIVTSTADSGAGSLRAALAAANDGDTIEFDAALNGQTINLTSGELVIGKNITVNGPGSNLLTVARSSGTFRIFHVMPGRSVIIGALTITGGNSGNGGGILNDHATLTVDSCKVQFNGAPGGFGGGIFNYGIGSSGATLTILNSTLSSNATTYGGGGIANDVTTGGSLTITNSVVTGNSASRADVSGGSEGNGGGIYDIGGTATLSISNSIVSNNRAGPDAGAHYPGGYGGGIYHSSGTVIITNSTIAGNSAGFAGGGIYTRTGTQTIMTITSSTVSGNSVFGVFEGQPTFSSGGGIDINGTLTITNSTFSGNSAYSVGGGISGGMLTIANSTLSGNTANSGGGVSTGTLEIGNTILKAGTSGANISVGTVTSHGYNLSSDNGGGFLTGPGDQINTDPLLGPLQNNGGPTFTHDLLSGSPAIDAGDPNFTPPPLYDQRGLGYPRVLNGRIDIGSVEVQSAFTPSPTPTATATATATAAPTMTPTPTTAPPTPTPATPTPTASPCVPGGAWTGQSPYPIAVSGNAVASEGGNIYSFGGISNNIAVTNAYKYTPATNTWTPIAFLPAPRGWFSAASDGTYIYLLGGVDENFTTTATLWRYDPATDTYNTSLPPYTIPTYFHATVYLNGKIYRIAGRATGTDFHVEVYDIATNSWTLAANYPFANHSLMAAALGGYIYGAGGNASPTKTYRYDPGTNTWDDAAIADLPAGRSAAASCVFNGMWLLAGGDVNFAVSTSVIAWSPVSNTWSSLPNMVQARDYLGGATAGQSLYAIAGNSGPGTPTNDNQRYAETSCTTPTPTPTPTSTPITISGTISYCSNPVPGPVPNVTLTLTGTMGGSTLSDGSGNYTFSLLAPGGNYTVTPTKSALTPGSAGINAVDVLAVQRHFLNIALIPVGCRRTAGDVNGDTVINAVDVLAIQRFFLGLSTGIANVGKYQFTPVNRTYLGLVSNQTAQNYDTLVFGDVASPFAE